MQLWDKCYINFKKINEITFQTTHLEVVLLYLVLLYYEVTLPDIFPLRHIFGGVTDWYQSTGYRELALGWLLEEMHVTWAHLEKKRTRLGLYTKSLEEYAYRLTPKKLPHHGIDLWLQVQIFYDHANPATRRTIDQSAGGKLRDKKAKESWALLKDLAFYDNESWNDPRDFAKPVKAISLPQDVPSTSECRLIELESQVQRLMEAHLAPKSFVQVNKITSSCEICSGPHDTQYCMENPEQAFVDYASSRTDEAGAKWYNFKPKQNNLGDTYNPSWKSHPNLRIYTLTVLAHAPMYNAIPDKYVESLELGKNGSVFIQGEMPKKMKDPELSTLSCRLGDSKPFDTLANLEYEKDPATSLLVGRGFLATASALIDCRKAKIAVGEGVTRSIFRVKEINPRDKEIPYWTTLGKRESYTPRPSTDGIGAQAPHYAKKDFTDYHLPSEWELARDAELNPFKDILVFRKMVEFLGTIPINLVENYIDLMIQNNDTKQ
ncbi:hypothetical protein Tco_0407054 [Tanacetum coccineum]